MKSNLCNKSLHFQPMKLACPSINHWMNENNSFHAIPISEIQTRLDKFINSQLFTIALLKKKSASFQWRACHHINPYNYYDCKSKCVRTIDTHSTECGVSPQHDFIMKEKQWNHWSADRNPYPKLPNASKLMMMDENHINIYIIIKSSANGIQTAKNYWRNK